MEGVFHGTFWVLGSVSCGLVARCVSAFGVPWNAFWRSPVESLNNQKIMVSRLWGGRGVAEGGPRKRPGGPEMGPRKRPQMAKTRAGRKRKYITKIKVSGVLAGSVKRLIIS